MGGRWPGALGVPATSEALDWWRLPSERLRSWPPGDGTERRKVGGDDQRARAGCGLPDLCRRPAGALEEAVWFPSGPWNVELGPADWRFRIDPAQLTGAGYRSALNPYRPL